MNWGELHGGWGKRGVDLNHFIDLREPIGVSSSENPNHPAAGSRTEEVGITMFVHRRRPRCVS